MGVTVRQKTTGKGKPWWVFINHQGQRKSLKIGDKEIADKTAKDIRRKLATGEYTLKVGTEDTVPKFRKLAEDWLENEIKVLRKSATYERYAHMLNKHILPVLGGKHLNAITRGDVKDFLLKKIKAGYAGSSITIMRDVTGEVFNYAIDKEIVRDSPVKGVTKRLDLKPDRSKEVDPLNQGETRIFLEACKKQIPEYYLFFYTALRTGLRLGELLALQWGDIDLNSKYMRVRRFYKLGKFSETKNCKGRRVDLSDQLVKELKAHKAKGLKLGIGNAPEQVFNRDGKPMEQNYNRRVFERVLDKAELREIRLHDLRHTYASQLLSLGESPMYVKEQLGHHSIQLTVDTYGHWIPSEGKTGVNRLDEPAPYMHSPKKPCNFLRNYKTYILLVPKGRFELPRADAH